ncbi:chemotaxis protein CheB [Brevundimonas sp.]|uniref:chemotaxis protein CheB n=1 Tax=Brevundimonas sp. TaxID=1871086 RepID=UPI00273097DC|nr:chemotaxis protein CheB [Brevundimonas sp.]MDP1913747.1 chemotaxis protein CheB [Brevundimonas sp.]
MGWSSLLVIGASAGGVDALRSMVAGLRRDLAAPVLIVLHIGAHRSELPALLSAAGPLPAKHADDNERMQVGQIYIAPPDRHMIVAGPGLRLTRGPRENWARPAINPLFRSAAEHYGRSAIGVILTGRLNDGTAGLYEIRCHGGVTVVQDPDDAAWPDMPRSAVTHGAPDYCPPLAEIAALLNRLVAESQGGKAVVIPSQALEEGRAMKDGQEFDPPVAVTCPDCGGALRRQEVGTLIEYRCHIQHVYTAEVLAEAQFDQMERVMRAGERIVHERSEFCRQMAVRAATTGAGDEERSWRAAERQALDRAYELRDLIEQDWIRPETDPRPILAMAAD